MLATAEKHQFPDCFPPDFEENILPKNLKERKMTVYRVCVFDKITRDAFLSTFENVHLGRRPKDRGWERKLRKPETYSTSCDSDYEAVLGTLDCLRRHHPAPFVMRGTASSDLGPLQPTSERTGRPTSHVDWWLYRDSDPSPKFQKYGGSLWKIPKFILKTFHGLATFF